MSDADLSVFAPLENGKGERRQSACGCLMVRPVHEGLFAPFEDSEEEGVNENNLRPTELLAKARAEFDSMVASLRAAGVGVHVVEGLRESEEEYGEEPIGDVFPSCWFSTHSEIGVFCVYSLAEPERRAQRRSDVLALLRKRYPEAVNFQRFETQHEFLEGTDLVLDRLNRIAYRCEVVHSASELPPSWEAVLGFVAMESFQGRLLDVGEMRTEIMLSVGTNFVVFCPDAVDGEPQKRRLMECFSETEKIVIVISLDQMRAFCGNVLEMHSRSEPDKLLLVMSKRAHDAFSPAQLETLRECVEDFVVCDVGTIEKFGGSSVGSMIAEIF